MGEIIQFPQPEEDEQDLLPIAILLAIKEAEISGYSTFFFEGARIDVSFPRSVA